MLNLQFEKITDELRDEEIRHREAQAKFLAEHAKACAMEWDPYMKVSYRKFFDKKVELQNQSRRKSYDENRRHDSFFYPKLSEKYKCQEMIYDKECELRRIEYRLSGGKTPLYRLF